MTKGVKLLINFFFDNNGVRAVEVFKWTVGCVFKCETTEMKFAKNVKKECLSKNVFVLCNILSNTYAI